MARFKSLVLALSLIPPGLCAQEFHAGQWGVQFGGGLSLPSIGFMRFTSPRSAWLLNFDFNGTFLTGTRTAVGSSSDTEDRTVAFFGDVGRRFYQDLRQKVRSFQSVGLRGGYINRKFTVGPGSDVEQKQWFAGVMGELGAAYWVTPSLSIGGSASVSTGYTHNDRSDPGGTEKLKGLFVSGVDLMFVVGLYF